MGEYDFTYELPKNFESRIKQFFQQFNKMNVYDIFRQCKYEYEDQGLAYYAGLRGDNWNKKAVDFYIEGAKENIDLLEKNEAILEQIIGKALKPSESGYLVRKIFYLTSDDIIDSMPSSNEERLNADIQSATAVLNDLIWIGERVCSNAAYNAKSSENSINDYFRDMLLSKGYAETKDQTRHGISASGKDAGEVDILLSKNGKEIAIFEGLRLNGVNTDYIDEHIEKSLDNYNALGTATFIVAYVSVANFQNFWEKYCEHLKCHVYGVEIKRPIVPTTYPNAVTRMASAVFSRDGFDFPAYFIAFKIG